MFISILLFLFVGLLVGILFGLVPGLHPNMIILLIPLVLAMNFGTFEIIAFVVSMAISNSIVNMIPSILLGAPEACNELSILPGHKMLLKGYGYDAVKLTVIGGFGAVLFTMLLMPVLIFAIPFVWSSVKPFIFVLLIIISGFLILSEEGFDKVVSLFIFLASGTIGLLSGHIQISDTLILFPIFSGFFGISFLILQVKNKVSVPKQKTDELLVSKKTINKSVFFGTIGGIVSGFLPGVGSSQIASLATVDKNDCSFLTTLGALTTSNILLSVISLWLIGRSRSGAAIILEQTVGIDFNGFLLVLIISLIVTAISVNITLFLSKRFLGIIEIVDYSKISLFIITLIVFMTIIFTGLVGLFVLIVCTCLGIFVNLVKIKRASMMGVLILPTILFFIGL
jgi:putative membrane protein